MTSQICIVDEHDNIINYVERNNRKPNEIYRIASLWLRNSEGKFLLAQRAFTKTHHPGLWGPAVAGTIEEGETYESNIVKETQEEIGLTKISINRGPKVFIHDPGKPAFCQFFISTVNADVQLTKDPEEVEALKWFTVNEALHNIDKNPNQFLDRMRSYILFFEKHIPLDNPSILLYTK